MLRTTWTFALLLLILPASPALATDHVEFGPAPAWVKAIAAAKPQASTDGSATRSLLVTQQVRLEPGRVAIYSESAMQILTPEGLKAGFISLQWRPDKDEIRVHRAVILRGGTTIDLLAQGKQFTILRREENLEQATLDGRLTAVLQPEGLQVGDILSFAVTVTSTDPVMGRHVEFASGLDDTASSRKIFMRFEWPAGLALRHREYGGLAPAAIANSGGWQSAEWTFSDPVPLVTPKGAPARFRLGRRVEFTDFANWGGVGELLGPLFDKASVIPATGPLRDEVDRIRKASPDPLARATAALALVEDKVRYVALLMGEGDYVPASAETTWSRRFGDCKAKTALLVGILRELGIQAAPVVVASAAGDGLDQRLPLIHQFDHVIVKASVGGRDYWLDGTRSGDAGLDLLSVPMFHWGLPVPGSQLVRMVPPPLAQPSMETVIALDGSGGGDQPAPARIEKIFRGDYGVAFNQVIALVPTASRDQALRAYWSENYPALTIVSTSASFDRAKAEYRLVADGTMKLTLDEGRYWTDTPTLGFNPDFKRDPGPNDKAPFAVEYPAYTRSVETITIPDRLVGMPLAGAEPIDRTLAGARYRRIISKQGKTFRIETSAQALIPETPYAEAIAAADELKKMDGDRYYVVLAAPTKEDNAQILALAPTTATDYLRRGFVLGRSGRSAEAILAFNQAIKLDPSSSEAFEGRGTSRLQSNDIAGARSDFEQATKLGSKLPLIAMVTASEAAKKGHWDEAIAALDSALKASPGSPQLLLARASFYHGKGDVDRAIADTREVTRLYPENAQARLLRINLLHSQEKKSEVLAEADALMKLKLTDAFGYVAAAKTYAAYDRTADALRAFDRALALKPEPYIYLNRAQIRPRSERAARRADLELALKLDPADVPSLMTMAELQAEEHDYAGSLANYNAAIASATNPAEVIDLRIHRGIAYLRLNQAARAEADFAFVRAEAETDSGQLNNLCWAKATAGLALDSALAECDQALKLQPDAGGVHDSRALVLLRLGRVDEAIAEYNRALELQKDLPSSLFGRALAWERKGDSRRAAADAAAAEAKSKAIRDTYRDMGLELKAK